MHMPKWSNAVPHMPTRFDIVICAGAGMGLAVWTFPYTDPNAWLPLACCVGWLIHLVRARRYWKARPQFAALTVEFRELVKGLRDETVYRTFEHGGAAFERATLRSRFPLSLVRPTFYVLARQSDDDATEDVDVPGVSVRISDEFTCSKMRGFPVLHKAKATRIEYDNRGREHKVGSPRSLSLWQRMPFSGLYRSGVVFANEDQLRVVVEQLRSAYAIGGDR